MLILRGCQSNTLEHCSHFTAEEWDVDFSIQRHQSIGDFTQLKNKINRAEHHLFLCLVRRLPPWYIMVRVALWDRCTAAGGRAQRFASFPRRPALPVLPALNQRLGTRQTYSFWTVIWVPENTVAVVYFRMWSVNFANEFLSVVRFGVRWCNWRRKQHPSVCEVQNTTRCGFHPCNK